jgi:cob(I)alamin adenosyltransferase
MVAEIIIDETTQTKTRIVNNPRTGNGDKGYSEILYNPIANESILVDKADDILFLQNQLESYRNQIALYLLDYPNNHSIEDRAILNRMVTKEVNNLCGQVYFNIKSTKVLVSEEFTKLIESRIADITSQLESQPEFITCSSKRYLHLDNIRIKTRLVEHLFWKVIRSFKNQRLGTVVKKTMAFINMMSDYIMQLNRLETILQNEDVTYWNTGD